MQTLRKAARSAIAVLLLAAISHIIIFHRQDAADHLRHWTSLIPKGLIEPAIALLLGVGLLILLIVLRRLAHAVASFGRFLWEAPATLPDSTLEPKDRIALENDLRANRIQVITTLVQALGGIAVLIGIYFAWANLKTTQTGQTETIRIANEGQITERFSKAIDQLGSSQLELRLGGIYSLESIANESPQYHWPIMEVLTTYVRVHAPVKEQQQKQPSEDDVGHQSNQPSPSPTPAAAPSPDIQAILTVIGRRVRTFEQGENERLDLSKTNIQYANLSNAHLENADLKGASLDGASLDGADLKAASLTEASLKDADLTAAQLLGAFLVQANLTGADLSGADLSGADLAFANLSRANLTGAFLTFAYLSGANLTRTQLWRATLSGADLDDADLSHALSLTQEQINTAEGDILTKLRPGRIMPESWILNSRD